MKSFTQYTFVWGQIWESFFKGCCSRLIHAIIICSLIIIVIATQNLCLGRDSAVYLSKNGSFISSPHSIYKAILFFFLLYHRAGVMPSAIYWFNKEWSWKSGVGCWWQLERMLCREEYSAASSCQFSNNAHLSVRWSWKTPFILLAHLMITLGCQNYTIKLLFEFSISSSLR